MCAVECFLFTYLSDTAWCLISVLGNSIFVEMSFIIFHIYPHPSTVWYVVCLCWFRSISTNTSKEFHIRSYHTLILGSRTGPDGSPQRLRSCHLQWSPSWWGPKAGGVGEGLELRPARVAQQWQHPQQAQQAQQQAQQQQDQPDTTRWKNYMGLVGGFREPFICHYYWENPRHYTPNLKKASPKFCDQKYRGRLNALHEVEILQVYHTFASALIPPKRVQFNEIHHNPVQHGLISIFTSWFNIDTLHDIKRDMFWTREEDWYPRPSKKQ